MENEERVTVDMTIVEWLDHILENDLVCYVLKGLSLAACIVFALATIVFGFCALLIPDAWVLFVVLFVIFGLSTGVSAGFFYFLCEEY